MCGILGCTKATVDQISAAAKTIDYRGPDFYGHFCDDEICLGHQRLSIIDLDPRSNQPMQDASENFTIVFNGEIYNYKKLKQDLRDIGLVFKTESDTEVVLNSYKHSGVDSIKNLQGMFAIGLYDKKNQKIVLARDHAGIKPLYYYNDNEFFAFASEIKSLVNLLRQKNVKIEIDQQSLLQFLVFGYIPNPNSLVRGIKKLPKSCYAEYDLTTKKLSIHNFEPKYKQVNNLEQFQDLIEEKVLDHLIADVPVGVFFSGGTDSSLIASILHKHNIKLKTFSIDLGNRDDKYYFEKINDFLNLDSRVYQFGKDEMNFAYHIVSSKIDEPTYDSSIYPTAYLSHMAAKEVKVVLSGEGGDEYFWGYHRHPALNTMKFKKERLAGLIFKTIKIFPIKKRRPILVKLGKLFKCPWLYYLASMSPSVEYLDYKNLMQVVKEVEGQAQSPVYLDRDLYLENDLLRKIDLATSYASIEGRVPLLDIDIIKNSESYKNKHLENSELKSLLKTVLTSYLPKELVYRKKSGFGLKGDAISACPELIEEAKSGLAYFNKQGLLPELNIDELMKYNPALIYASASMRSSLKNLGLLSSD